MSRKTVSEKEGFKVTWLVTKRHEDLHKWWHFFFRVVQGITVHATIKGVTYVKTRLWVTTCRKCGFKKLEAREFWLPGEVIPEETPDFLNNNLALIKTMKHLDEVEAKQ